MDGMMVERMACARIPTDLGEFQLCLYSDTAHDKEHLALVMGDVRGMDNVLVRVHSECFTGDVLGSRRCDCGEQLQRSMALIAQAGSGVIVYLRQEDEASDCSINCAPITCRTLDTTQSKPISP